MKFIRNVVAALAIMGLSLLVLPAASAHAAPRTVVTTTYVRALDQCPTRDYTASRYDGLCSRNYRSKTTRADICPQGDRTPSRYDGLCAIVRRPTSAPSGAGGGGQVGIVNTAMAYRGVAYRGGGTSRAGFDCSGYVQRVYRDSGKSIPRTTGAIQQRATRVSNPQPGDIMFWGAPAYHVAIYVGPGKMIDSAVPGTTVQVRNIWGNPTYGRI